MLERRRWTPDLVADRLEDALRVTIMSEARPGPRGARTAWPEMLRSAADEFTAGGAAFARTLEQRADEIMEASNRRFSADQMTAAERAIAWPRAHLADELDRDAVWLVLMGRVTRLNVELVLKRRRARAGEMIDRRAPEFALPDTVRIYEDDAADAAAKITAWANAALAEPVRAELIGQARARKRAAMTRETGRRPKRLPDLTPEEFKAVRRERDESIRRAARERMKREVRAAGIVERIAAPPSPINRAEVMPGRNFTRAALYRRFNAALDAIAAALNG